jgi:hypothetical protein
MSAGHHRRQIVDASEIWLTIAADADYEAT